jgi:hypothetical protein
MAERMTRLRPTDHKTAVALFEDLYRQIDRIAVTEPLVRSAGELANRRALRAYDAVHLAATLLVAEAELTFVTADQTLRSAASDEGLAVTDLRLRPAAHAARSLMGRRPCPPARTRRTPARSRSACRAARRPTS